MKIEEHVLSVEQMKHLKELGMKVEDTALCWWEYHTDEFVVMPVNSVPEGLYYPTLTLQEILELLPRRIATESNPNYTEYKLEIYPDYQVISYVDVRSGKEAWGELWGDSVQMSILNAAYAMLCWVLEKGYLIIQL